MVYLGEEVCEQIFDKMCEGAPFVVCFRKEACEQIFDKMCEGVPFVVCFRRKSV